MDILVFLVPLALGLGGLGLAGFLWSLNAGQYDDLDGAAWRAIMDDEPASRAPPVPLDQPAAGAITDFSKPIA
ncbi:cbb3-type cytochrome oxidase assembly protein CcoS, partial [Stenotrophomonas maltophilia]|uniref:cbb3-type cytochrome oxidase assembly protein CcoS n=1 Tax=Stenotrophomonas maltophilia TaxID=40324 RepID=UPI0013DADAD6